MDKARLGPSTRHVVISTHLLNIGDVLMLRRQFDQAKVQFQQALSMDSQLLKNHPKVAMDIVAMAQSAYLKGDLKAAGSFYQAAMEVDSKLFTDRSVWMGDYFVAIGRVWQALNQPRQALAAYQRALLGYKTELDEDDLRLAQLYLRNGQMHRQLDRAGSARHVLEKALSIAEEGGADYTPLFNQILTESVIVSFR